MERAASNACLASDTLRAMVEAPTITPSASRIGVRLSETCNTVPSFRRRSVSRWSITSPRPILARMSVISSFPSALRTWMDRPIISRLE